MTSVRDYLISLIFPMLGRTVAPRPTVSTPPATPASEARKKDRLKIRPEAVAKVLTSSPPNLRLYTSSDVRGPDANPFRAAQPPKGVVPSGVKPMAMDDANIAEMFSQTYGSWTENLYWFGYPYLSELTQRGEYRRLSETIAREMTRKWVKIIAKGTEDKSEKIKLIEEEIRKHDLQHKFRRVAELDGFFGRAHLYLDMVGTAFDDRDGLKTPLILHRNTVEIGALKNITVVEPTWTYPGPYNTTNPLAPDFYRPATWYVMSREVHRSRLLTFVSREMPDLLKPAYSFGGLSMSQMAKPYVDNWLRTRQSISDLIHSFSTMVFKTDMSGILNDGGGDEELNRATLFNVLRDNRGLFMVDKNNEDLVNVSTPLGTLDHLQAQSQEHMSSISGEPLVILTGIQPSGLNATSEGELQVWAQYVKAMQELLFTENFRTVLELIQLSLFGEIDKGITFEWNALKEESETDEATRRKTEADTDAVYVTAGVLAPEEIREKLASEEEGIYAGIDLSGPPPEPPEAEVDPALEGEEPEAEDGGNNPFARLAGAIQARSKGGAAGMDGPDAEDIFNRLATAIRERSVNADNDNDNDPFSRLAEAVYERLAQDAWNEGDHPRDESGRFGSGPGGGASVYKEHAAVNDWLRGDRSPAAGSEKKNRELIKEMDAAIASNSLAEPAMVYRSYGAKELSKLVNKSGVLSDKAYTSVTRDPEIARGFHDPDNPHEYIAKIELPAGTNAYDFGPDDEQQEMILPRGMKFKVNGVDHTKKELRLKIISTKPKGDS